MISFLASTLPASFDWLSWALLSRPAGLVLIGVGLMGLELMSQTQADGEF